MSKVVDVSADADAVIELTPQLVVDQCAELGEAPFWDSRREELLWIDVIGAKIFIYNPQNGFNTQLDLASKTQHVTTIVPIGSSSHEVVIGTTTGIAKMDLSIGIESFEEHPWNNKIPGHGEFVRMNDGKCDPQGRLWIGSISRQGPGGADLAVGGAAFYCYDGWKDEAPTKVLDGITVSNGVTWSLDARTMYYTDSPTFHVDAMDFDGSAEDPTLIATNRRQHFEVSDGFPPVPDGNAMDTDGMLWVACFGVGEVRRYDPQTGKIKAVVRLPPDAGKESTAVAFGGDNLDELYITTAHEFWDKQKISEFPKAGALYKVPREELRKSGNVRGVKPNHFKMAKGKGLCGAGNIQSALFPEGTYVEVTSPHHADSGQCGFVIKEVYDQGRPSGWRVEFEDHASWIDAVKLASGLPSTKLASRVQSLLATPKPGSTHATDSSMDTPEPSRGRRVIPRVKTREYGRIRVNTEGEEEVDTSICVGCKVEVRGGTAIGKRGKVLKENNGRYRVLLEDGTTTWTTKVNVV